MRTSVTIGYGLDKRAIRPNREICVIDAHPPDILGSLEDLATEAWVLFKAHWNPVVEIGETFNPPDPRWVPPPPPGGYLESLWDILPDDGIKSINDVVADKNSLFLESDDLAFERAGSYRINRQRVHPDEIRIVFRATSEDDITKSFGHAYKFDSGDESQYVSTDEIIDLAETKTTNQYKRAFSIPLKTITPSLYLFAFASGDDGWLFDVGAVTFLWVRIWPRPDEAQREPAKL